MRRELATRRAALSAAERSAASAVITSRCLEEVARLADEAVFVYVSFNDEVETRDLIDAIVNAGRRVAIPKLEDRQTMIAVEFHGWQTLRPGRLGIPEPPGNTAIDAEIGIAFVPGLGFDSAGNRLGYGAGYYDRWLIRNQGVRAIGLAYHCQRVTQLEAEAHDVPMANVIFY
ncbi:MAG: 5-formyltetrahydrofolate cyclo-ligase [Pseudomonadota bacterium]